MSGLDGPVSRGNHWVSGLERADRIGEFWSYPQSRTFAELLIDCEEDRALVTGSARNGERTATLSSCLTTADSAGGSCRP